MPPPPIQEVEFKGELGDPVRGREIAFTLSLGNCIACHQINGATQAGTIGPSLVDYARRGNTADYIYQTVWDIRLYKPDAHMPPFGTNGVLTDQQIRDVIAFLQILK